MNTQSLAQRRARHALGLIQKHEKAAQDSYQNYVSYAESLPATILMNGLGQACATLLAKAEGKLDRPHGLLYEDLQSWLCGGDSAAPFRNSGNLMEAIIGSKQDTYFRAQAEALAYLVWLKKFANAFLKRGTPK
jgi:CRISPR-associated protein Cmr5